MIELASFRTEITPPLGHPLCGGWRGHAEGVSDPLFANGIVLRSKDTKETVVLCAMDWCMIANHSYFVWKEALAEAAGTMSNHVMLHCMHPHCSPWADEEAQRLVQSQSGIEDIIDIEWCNETMNRVAEAIRQAMTSFQSADHLRVGRGEVEKVASNRRLIGEDGKSWAVRWTRTMDPKARAAPEGDIDRYLKTISFWNGDSKLAALHYYAVHPSSYEDTIVTHDFTGIARERRIQDDAGIPHLYFTECAGDITAGKYNDGATENRAIFTDRIYRAMVASEETAHRVDANDFQLNVTTVDLPPRDDMIEADLMEILKDNEKSSLDRSRAAMMLSYLHRTDTPLEVTALHFGDEVAIVHLPGEAFMEYQYHAQRQKPNAFIAVPAYGDCGPVYICKEGSFAEGGYEPIDAFVAERSEPLLKKAIERVMN